MGTAPYSTPSAPIILYVTSMRRYKITNSWAIVQRTLNQGKQSRLLRLRIGTPGPRNSLRLPREFEQSADAKFRQVKVCCLSETQSFRHRERYFSGRPNRSIVPGL